MAGTALKRLMAEYKQLTLNPPEGIVAGPMNEENFFEWEALIMSRRLGDEKETLGRVCRAPELESPTELSSLRPQ